LELYDVFRNTTAEVQRASKGRQVPRLSEVSITEKIYLAGQGIAPSVRPEAAPPPLAAGQVFKDCLDCPEMVVIPADNFQMGSNEYDGEKPIHSVSINRFALGKFEVTQGQWKAVMGSNPSHFKDCGDNCPVEQVSWDDALAFIQKLNQKTGQNYRLPSESEWEYACRAGANQTYCGSDNVDRVAVYDKNSGNETHPAGSKQPNEWGLYDMSGSVWE